MAALLTLLEHFGEWNIIFCAVELVYAIIVLAMEDFVVSFLISGILCFGISAIYNHFEKQGQQ